MILHSFYVLLEHYAVIWMLQFGIKVFLIPLLSTTPNGFDFILHQQLQNLLFHIVLIKDILKEKNKEALALAQTDVDAQEKKANALSLWVGLVLSLLVSIGGLRLLESLFAGAPAALDVFSLDDFNAAMTVAKQAVADAKPTQLSLEDALQTEMTSVIEALKDQHNLLALKTFRGVDLVVTTGLLAGGSAGIRSIIKALSKNS